MVPLGSNHPQSGVNSLSQPASNKTSSGMVIIKAAVSLAAIETIELYTYEYFLVLYIYKTINNDRSTFFNCLHSLLI